MVAQTRNETEQMHQGDRDEGDTERGAGEVGRGGKEAWSEGEVGRRRRGKAKRKRMVAGRSGEGSRKEED